MAKSRAEVAHDVLLVLMQAPQYRGTYTPEAMNVAIQEAIDFLNVEFFIGVEGWAVKLYTYENVPGNCITLPVQPGMSMIQEVRIQYGNIYIPCIYDDANRRSQFSEQSGVQQWNSSYRIIDNEFYFNPPLIGSNEGQDFSGRVLVEYQGYSKRLQSDTDYLETHFDHAMLNFIKYRTATILSARIERFIVPWSALEKQWYDKCQQIIEKRNSQTTQIKEFEGGGAW